MVKLSRESGDFDPICQGLFGLLGAATLLCPLWKNLSQVPAHGHSARVQTGSPA